MLALARRLLNQWLGDLNKVSAPAQIPKNPLPAVQAAGGDAVLLAVGHFGESAPAEIIKHGLPLTPGAHDAFLGAWSETEKVKPDPW